ncbi:hypothetical protein [Bauldia sp.]|uniref:hypothetical protein n=1 Tax=Bauldia sp. TaxID=2575872 RepID=UPI003BA96B06
MENQVGVTVASRCTHTYVIARLAIGGDRHHANDAQSGLLDEFKSGIVEQLGQDYCPIMIGVGTAAHGYRPVPARTG